MVQQALPPAGWYPDNLDQSRVRWWDGREWTPATQPKQPQTPSRAEIAQQRAAAKTAAKQARAAAKSKAAADRSHARAVAANNKSYPKAHAAWAADMAMAQKMLEQAKTFEPGDTGDTVLKPGEANYLGMACDLIEERDGQRQYVAGHQGFSIPIGTMDGHAVRYNVGRTQGHSVQGPPVATVIASGKVVVSNQRITFIGPKQTRECLFTKIVSITWLSDVDVTISVTNRQKPLHLQFAGHAAASVAKFSIGLSQADQTGSRDGFVKAMQQAVDALAAAEPQLQS